MQDIDFDEIDRAVSSVTSSNTETNSPDVKEATASGFTSVSTPITPREAPTSFGSPAARRSTGRFMDVVHPSSDMRPTASTASTAPIVPLTPSVQREVVSRDDADRRTVAERSPQSLNPSSAFHWPDPINAPQLPATEPDVVAPEEDLIPELALPAPLEDIAVSPLESPFLADAKVEKRPLGAFSLPESDLPLLEDFNDQFGHVEDMVVEEAEVIEVAEPTEKEELLLEAHNDSSDLPLPGPTSISQQYTEQVSTTSEPTAAIYDTDAYHQALVHQPKKHGSGQIILWIIALILAGGGIGAAIYFFVLPML